jgi:hypothetical protein
MQQTTPKKTKKTANTVAKEVQRDVEAAGTNHRQADDP